MENSNILCITFSTSLMRGATPSYRCSYSVVGTSDVVFVNDRGDYTYFGSVDEAINAILNKATNEITRALNSARENNPNSSVGTLEECFEKVQNFSINENRDTIRLTISQDGQIMVASA